MIHQPQANADELLELRDIEALLKKSAPTVNRWRKGEGCGDNGPFPQPDAWAGVHPRWYRSTVEGWAGSARHMEALSVRFEVPGKTVDFAIREYRRIVEGNVGLSYRLWLRTLADGSNRIEIRWPKSIGLDPKAMIVSLTLGDTFPRIFGRALLGALQSRPDLMQKFAGANKKLLTNLKSGSGA